MTKSEYLFAVELLDNLLSEYFTPEESDVFKEIYIPEITSISNKRKINFDYKSEDTRGFGGGEIYDLPIDTLISVIRWLFFSIAGKVSGDAATHLLYKASLDAIKNMPKELYVKWLPWTERIEKYLVNKTN